MVFEGGFSDVRATQTRADFQRQVSSFTKRLGFETFCAALVIDHMPGEAEFITIGDSPAAAREGWRQGAGTARDSLLAQCKRSPAPVVWSSPRPEQERGPKGRRPTPRSVRRRNGICVALHLSEARHFLLGVERPGRTEWAATELTRTVVDLQMFAVQALDAASRVLLPVPKNPAIPSLTPRELSAIRWAMQGKTPVEIAVALGVNERTAHFHLDTVSRKLGCVNTHQALLKALRLGLLD